MRIMIETEKGCWNGIGASVTCENGVIALTAESVPVRTIKLRWERRFEGDIRILGDAWERSYGELHWGCISPHRILPWYFLLKEGNTIYGYGVKTQPSAMCFWNVDSDGFTLTMDVRCGGEGVVLNGARKELATIVMREYPNTTAYDAAKRFCTAMCDAPLLPEKPVYGGNNWYYAYGHSSHEEILRDSELIARLTEGLENRPYMVIDDCWQEFRTDEYIGGPWERGNVRFPDMKRLIAEMSERGVLPGVWLRLLLNKTELPTEARHNGYLDPTHPAAQAIIRADIERMVEWGFKLIKHDFSTFDLFGKWGFEMNPYVTNDGWHFYDRSKTSAEVVKDFYRLILEATAGKAVIIGCNTIGHLGAGLMHVYRTGDDTSGMHWERTRRMGVNTLAFRLPQHRTFYECDADCVGITDRIDWNMNRQWADVIAESGTSLFVSIQPNVLTSTQEDELRAILAKASVGKTNLIPADWEYTDCPVIWKNETVEKRYQWVEESGNCMDCRHDLFEAYIPM